MDPDLWEEQEVIIFLTPTYKTKTSLLEVKYTIGDSSFKTQLLIFQGNLAEEFLCSLYKFN